MSSKRSAFTLIELMIVVTIMSTLPPSLSHKYADYTQRTGVTSALTGIASLKNRWTSVLRILLSLSVAVQIQTGFQ
jgi:prepilin-type N-terminal cleavage/methylation domain-containing protein